MKNVRFVIKNLFKNQRNKILNSKKNKYKKLKK